MQRIIGIVAITLVMFWCGSAMALHPVVNEGFEPGAFVLDSQDFGSYDDAGNWEWNDNFYPTARFYITPDGSQASMTPKDGYQLAQTITWETEYMYWAVAPHRDGVNYPVNQQDCFKWVEVPGVGIEVPQAAWVYQPDGVNPDGTTGRWWMTYHEYRPPTDFGVPCMTCQYINMDGVHTQDLGLCIEDWVTFEQPVWPSDEITPLEYCNQSCIETRLEYTGTEPVASGSCDQFPHGAWSTCKGKFLPDDMGELVNGTWVWKEEFKNWITYFNESGWNGDWNDMTPYENKEVTIQYGRLDNRTFPNGVEDSRLGGLLAYDGGTYYPSVWKVQLSDGVIRAHVDWIMKSECQELCNNNGCPWDNGIPYTIDDNIVCSWNPNDIYAGVEKQVSGGHQVEVGDVVKVSVDDSEAGPAYVENGKYWYLSYDTGPNALRDRGINTYRELYFDSFGEGHIPEGEHEAILEMKDGREVTLPPLWVKSNRAMPTVAATYEYAVEKLNKSGKSITTGQTVTAQNITARELDGQLIIQFNEPDGAFQEPLVTGYNPDGTPIKVGIRLRVWVGDMTNANHDVTFLWIDAPVWSGTVVVPPAQLQWIKSEMARVGRTTLDIGGMYREQFDAQIGYHNRGYIENIEYSFAPLEP